MLHVSGLASVARVIYLSTFTVEPVNADSTPGGLRSIVREIEIEERSEMTSGYPRALLPILDHGAFRGGMPDYLHFLHSTVVSNAFVNGEFPRIKETAEGKEKEETEVMQTESEGISILIGKAKSLNATTSEKSSMGGPTSPLPSPYPLTTTVPPFSSFLPSPSPQPTTLRTTSARPKTVLVSPLSSTPPPILDAVSTLAPSPQTKQSSLTPLKKNEIHDATCEMDPSLYCQLLLKSNRALCFPFNKDLGLHLCVLPESEVDLDSLQLTHLDCSCKRGLHCESGGEFCRQVGNAWFKRPTEGYCGAEEGEEEEGDEPLRTCHDDTGKPTPFRCEHCPKEAEEAEIRIP